MREAITEVTVGEADEAGDAGIAVTAVEAGIAATADEAGIAVTADEAGTAVRPGEATGAGIAVTAVGGFPVGGEEREGRFEGQCYVQYVRLAWPRGALPLLMLHGGGLTGACFGDTPDGRAGWQWDFLRAGLDVLVADGVGYGRASYRPRPTEALLRDRQTLWDLFRIGYPDTRFPTAAFDAFLKQVVPVNRDLPALRQAGYDAALKQVGPCLLLSHSAAGPYAFRSALILPSTVRAHIAVEPSGAPDPDKTDLAPLRTIPHLFLWGDHLDDAPMWRDEYASTRRFHEALLEIGADSEWIDLPARGIAGNSHLLMMDDNSAELSGLLCAWLRTKGFIMG
jgi:hypothetical protein